MYVRKYLYRECMYKAKNTNSNFVRLSQKTAFSSFSKKTPSTILRMTVH